MGAASLALAGGLVVGAGARDMEHGALLNGIEAFIQYPVTPSLRVEGLAALRLRGVSDAVAQEALARAYEANPDTTLKMPLRNDRIVAGAFVDLTPVPALRTKELSGALHLRGGLEGRLVSLDYGSVSPDWAVGSASNPMALEAQPATAFRVGPALGVAFDAWLGDLVGVRWAGTGRFTIEEEPDFGNVGPNGQPLPLDSALTASFVWSLDLMTVL